MVLFRSGSNKLLLFLFLFVRVNSVILRRDIGNYPGKRGIRDACFSGRTHI